MTMLAVAPPADAVPTGTYVDRGTLRIVAAPGDRTVQVAVEQFDGGEAPGEADTITCLSHGTVVHADPVDRVSGCRVVLHA
jgi:hypothetical protein